MVNIKSTEDVSKLYKWPHPHLQRVSIKVPQFNEKY